MRVCSECKVEQGDVCFYKTKGQCKDCILKRRALVIRQRACGQCGEMKDHILFPKHGRVCKRCLGQAEPAVIVLPPVRVPVPVPNACPKAWMQKVIRESKARARLLNIRRFHEDGYEFDIDLEHCESLWDKQEGRCALSGLNMAWNVEGGRPARLQNASLDRIDSTKNYSKANTQLVCMAPNMMKSTFTMDELLLFVRNIALHHPL